MFYIIMRYKPFVSFPVCHQGLKIWWEPHLLEVLHIFLFCRCIDPQSD